MGVSQNMSIPTEFFTLASFTTLLGLTGITVVVTNTLRMAFNLSKPWIGLLVAIACTEAGVALSGMTAPGDILLGLLNSCLVFLTAAGSANAIAARDEIEPHSVDEPAAERTKFLSRWF